MKAAAPNDKAGMNLIKLLSLPVNHWWILCYTTLIKAVFEFIVVFYR
jgi:hypothetical protein